MLLHIVLGIVFQAYCLTLFCSLSRSLSPLLPSLSSTPRRIRRVKSVTPQSNSSSTPGTPKRAASVQQQQPPALSVNDISSLLAGKAMYESHNYVNALF